MPGLKHVGVQVIPLRKHFSFRRLFGIARKQKGGIAVNQFDGKAGLVTVIEIRTAGGQNAKRCAAGKGEAIIAAYLLNGGGCFKVGIFHHIDQTVIRVGFREILQNHKVFDGKIADHVFGSAVVILVRMRQNEVFQRIHAHIGQIFYQVSSAVRRSAVDEHRTAVGTDKQGGVPLPHVDKMRGEQAVGMNGLFPCVLPLGIVKKRSECRGKYQHEHRKSERRAFTHRHGRIVNFPHAANVSLPSFCERFLLHADTVNRQRHRAA